MGKKKNKILKVILAVAILIIVLAAVLGIWQRDNIKAAIYGLQHDTEDIQYEMEAANKEMDDAVSDYDIPDAAADVSDEIAAGVVDGTMDINAVVDDMLKGGRSDGVSSKEKSAADADAEVQRLVTKLYVLRGSYTSRLDDLITEAKNEFYALPESQRTDTARRRIVSAKISKGSAMESACDAQVSNIVSQIRSTLSAAGKSTALADQVTSTYEREKQLKKSYYMSLV